MYKPNTNGDYHTDIVIDIFCGSGGFTTEVYISSFIVWMILLLVILHARESYKKKAINWNKNPTNNISIP